MSRILIALIFALIGGYSLIQGDHLTVWLATIIVFIEMATEAIIREIRDLSRRVEIGFAVVGIRFGRPVEVEQPDLWKPREENRRGQ